MGQCVTELELLFISPHFLTCLNPKFKISAGTPIKNKIGDEQTGQQQLDTSVSRVFISRFPSFRDRHIPAAVNMPPMQSINIVTSAPLYPSSLDSGSFQHLPPNHHDDLVSWASALSSKAAHSRISAETNWVNVALDPIEGETNWQEEAHWMSFHHAIQSLVVSCHQGMEQPDGSRQSSSHGRVSNRKKANIQSNGSPKSSTSGSCSSLARSVTQQLLAKAAVPIETVLISAEEASKKTTLALSLAELDEWEIMGLPET